MTAFNEYVKNFGVLKGVGMWLFNAPAGERIRYPIDEDKIKSDKLIKAQQQQIQGREAQLAKIFALEREKKEAEKEEDYREEIAQRLKENHEEIKGKRFTHTFSLRTFMNRIGHKKKPSKIGKKLEITDKDDKITYGILGDILVGDDGYVIITNEKDEIIAYGRDFNQVIWKPEALANYMKRNRIPLAIDEEGRPVMDFEEEEHSDVMYDSDNDEYRETEMKRRPVREMLIERDERIRELQRSMERLEQMNIQKEYKITTLNRTVRLLENRSNLSQSQLSDTLSKAMEFESSVAKIHAEKTKLTEIKALYENLIEKYKSLNDRLLVKLESNGDKTMREYVKAEVADDLELLRGFLPQKEPFLVPTEPKEKVMAQPGQPIERRVTTQSQ
jgi:hypothetical protein